MKKIAFLLAITLAMAGGLEAQTTNGTVEKSIRNPQRKTEEAKADLWLHQKKAVVDSTRVTHTKQQSKGRRCGKKKKS
jgi:hypothetical protein